MENKMNIFVLHSDPVIAAQMNCDSHVIKITTEVFQMLGSALRKHGCVDAEMPLTKSGTPLIGGHKNHPVTLWVGRTRSNFLWACLHGIALAEEYTYRYGKTHFCLDGLYQMADMSDRIPIGPQTPFAQAMPDEYKSPCAVNSYRDFYWHDKRKNIKCEWKKTRQKPYWWLEWEGLEELCWIDEAMGLYE